MNPPKCASDSRGSGAGARASGRFSSRKIVDCERNSSSNGNRPSASLNIGSRRGVVAFLDVKAGTIIGKCMPRHRAQEFCRFLETVESMPWQILDIHIVMDGASSHKNKLIRDWFATRRRAGICTLTPISSSSLNQAERFFALLTDQQIKRGAALLRYWRPVSLPKSTSAMPTPGPFAGPKPPTTSWLAANGFVTARSPSRPNVDRNF